VLFVDAGNVAADFFRKRDQLRLANIGGELGAATGNLEKIVEHGQRADNIVKSMLEHSRGVSGERRQVDLNALIEEALNLAYLTEPVRTIRTSTSPWNAITRPTLGR
jgi:hypothetical protein